MSANPNYRLRARAWLVARYVLMTVLAVIVVFPLYILFLDSMLSVRDITSTPPVLFSWHLNWSIFATAWKLGGLGHALWISTIQTGAIVAGQLVTSILAAFAFAYLTFPFKRTLYVLTLATLMIPFEVTLITNLQTVATWGLLNNIGGLVVPFLATGFGIFLLREAFSQIPREMREAAVIDGYTNMQYLRRVAVPMARPTIAALAVFSFLGAWNSYLWPAIVTSNNPAIRTLQIQIKSIGGNISTANLQIAAAAIAAFPLLLILIFFQKHLIRSLTAGAVK
jgi:sn-glycerol 3-phosphate transport system permease protein